MEERRAGLEWLPLELLQEIQLLSLSPALPFVSKKLYYSLAIPSPSFAALYLLRLYTRPNDANGTVFIARALRHGICTLETLKAIERIWERRTFVSSVGQMHDGRPRDIERSQASDGHNDKESPRVFRVPPLELVELPRRLFRERASPSQDTYLSPLVKYLFSKYNAPASSYEGYALSRAVILHDLPLIDFLLAHGADPSLRNAIAVQLAVDKSDLPLVKLLVERKEEGDKRRRLADRVQITDILVARAMRNDRTPEGREIIDYFVNEKGTVPSLNSILKMGKQHSKRPAMRPRKKRSN